jgi:hypothetical protein
MCVFSAFRTERCNSQRKNFRKISYLVCWPKSNRHSLYLWLQASATTQMLSALFWDFTQRLVVVLYRRFETTYRYHLQASRSPRRKLSSWASWVLNMGPICCTETSVGNCDSALLNIPEQRRYLLCVGSNRKITHFVWKTMFIFVYNWESLCLLWRTHCGSTNNWSCQHNSRAWSIVILRVCYIRTFTSKRL